MGRAYRHDPDDDLSHGKRRDRIRGRELGRTLKARERVWRERELTGVDDTVERTYARHIGIAER